MSDGVVVGENGAVASEVLPTCKWSLFLIVRDCADELERCLKTIAAYPNEIVVVNTAVTEAEKGCAETSAVAKKYGAKVHRFPWIEDFAAARNFAVEKCSHDVVMWLDSDDLVDNAAALDRTIRAEFGGGSLGAMFVEYLYAFDKIDFDGTKPVRFGRCTAVQVRERVVDRRAHVWTDPIHELWCEKFHVVGKRLDPQTARIRHVHLHEEEANSDSLQRNLRIIEHHYLPVEKGGLGAYCNERMTFYWANTLMGLKRFKEALAKYLEYIPRSGADAEIQQAFEYGSECARLMGNTHVAKALAHQALDKNPATPTPYYLLALAHREERNEVLAEHYAVECLARADNFQQEVIANPSAVFGGAALLAANCKTSLHKYHEVEPLLKVAERYVGKDHPEIVGMRKVVARESERGRLLNAYATLRDEIGTDPAAQRALARAAPKGIANHPEIARFLPKVRPADRRTVTFLCSGGMPPPWGPELLETGIGGSEEAVCLLSAEFVKRGWHAEVFAPCKRQTWQGVEWYPFDEFPGSDDETATDALVVWRSPFLIDALGSRARRSYVWLHDMPTPRLWPHGIWNGYDGIFVLSQFHADAYDFLPTSKKILSANGMATQSLVPIDQLANEPHRLVYASDPTRGLIVLLTWWEQIRKAVPDAELDVFYGFHPTLMGACRGSDPYSRQLAALVRRIDELRTQPGINWKGFVGQKELHVGMSKAGVFAYPCTFPEISCITAMKMQAMGATPVTSDFAALKETVTHGVKVGGDFNDVAVQKTWCDALVNQLQNPWTSEQRIEMALDARAKFSWARVAEQWACVFEKDLALPKRNRFYQRGRLDLVRASE